MANLCQLHKHYQHHVEFHVQHSLIIYAVTVQTNCRNFLQECPEIRGFCRYISFHIYFRSKEVKSFDD